MPGAHEQGTEMCSDVGERFLPSLSLSTPPIPPTSGRFCRKWAPILPWVPDFWAVLCGRCAALVPLTWGNVGVLKSFE